MRVISRRFAGDKPKVRAGDKPRLSTGCFFQCRKILGQAQNRVGNGMVRKGAVCCHGIVRLAIRAKCAKWISASLTLYACSRSIPQLPATIGFSAAGAAWLYVTHIPLGASDRSKNRNPHHITTTTQPRPCRGRRAHKKRPTRGRPISMVMGSD